MSDKKTVAETNAYNEQYIAGIQNQVNEAGAQAGAAKDVLDSAMENNETYSNTGLGTGVAKDANGLAIGTYEWDKQAEHTAKISYNSDVLSAKQEATTAKQELTANQQQGQAQYDMAAYSAQQSAEKAGWTGGYILDSNRQVEFLKESIKASLYSQEELQKYGYDTALAAARANYDLKKSELAMQHYNTAVENAFRMAEYTGKFISPEASFHISQLGTAEKIKSDPNSSQEERDKAEAIIASTESWFKTNNISKEGMYCISQLVDHYTALQGAYTNLQNALTAANEEAREYKLQLISTQEAADAKNETSIKDGLFSYVDEYGELKTISANYNQALITGTVPKDLPENDKAVYTNNVSKYFTNSVLVPEVQGRLNGIKFKTEADAQKAAIIAIGKSVQKVHDNYNEVIIGEFPVTVNINGKDTTITIAASDKIKGYKNVTDDMEILKYNTLDTNTSVTENGITYQTTMSTKYSDTTNYLKGLDAVKDGENFHIKRTSDRDGNWDDWELELWISLTEEDAKTEGLSVDTITETGIYYVNNLNKYMGQNTNISGHVVTGGSPTELQKAKTLGTAYFVKCDPETEKITSIHVIGIPEQYNFASNYLAFMEALKADAEVKTK